MAPSEVADTAASPDLPVPSVKYSMDVNAFNFCRFSLLRLQEAQRSQNDIALIAIPNLVESSYVRRLVVHSEILMELVSLG